MELAKLTSSETLFSRLPGAIGQSRTDVDGKFSIQVPRGEQVVLGAKGNRSVGDKMEEYFWLVALPKAEPGVLPVLLSNHNLAETSEDSYVSLVLWQLADEKADPFRRRHASWPE